MQSHFLTISDSEQVAAVSNMQATQEGDPFWVIASGSELSTPMYRLDGLQNTYLFTTWIDERDAAANEEGLTANGIAFWCIAPTFSNTNTSFFSPLFRGYCPSTGDHVYTLDASEITNNSNYNFEGIACFVVSHSLEGNTPLFRLRTTQGHHFYTVSEAEKNQLISLDKWVDEGVCGFVNSQPESGPSPFYRSYDPNSGCHYYTTDIIQHQAMFSDLHYRADGISGYIFQNGMQPDTAVQLIRLYNKATGDNIYTTSQQEIENATKNLGYSNEGFYGWVLPPSVGVNTNGSVPMHSLVGDFAPNFLIDGPLPPDSLTSSSNFIMTSQIGSGQDVIVGAEVRIIITSDLTVNSVNKGDIGVGFQLNAVSPAGFTSSWQQYCFAFATGEIKCTINNWPTSPYSYGYILQWETVCKIKGTTLKAGYVLTISLINDVYGFILVD